MTGNFDERSTSARRLFVIQVSPDVQPASGPLRGRIEHVWSGRAVEFQSLHTALEFIAATLDVPRVPGSQRITDAAEPGPAEHIRASPVRALTRERLCHRYNLTAAEATLAIELADGRSLREAATRLGIRVNTARAHLRQIFGKTDTNRQVALVRLLLTEG